VPDAPDLPGYRVRRRSEISSLTPLRATATSIAFNSVESVWKSINSTADRRTLVVVEPLLAALKGGAAVSGSRLLYDDAQRAAAG
jgi:hypothetical protein